ncbi:MAG: glycoside hydrolase family 127 protein [Bacillota bacterium]|nr:glycoside hydrolase family 127 protein [Bacillota bacterium]
MKSMSYKNVVLKDGFWKKKQDMNKEVTIDAVWNRFSDTGRIKAFDFDWKEGDPFRPHIFWDSDVAKWIEGASYIIGLKENPLLEEKIESVIDKIEEHQDTSGYFNIYFTVVRPGDRFKERGSHELYCAGHLIEASIAYYEATGKDRFLKLMEKYTDYIYDVFYVKQSAAFVTPGHEEIELALIKLFNTTGKQKYLDLSKFFIDKRGTNAKNENDNISLPARNIQSHIPVRRQREAVGHAVRAVYLYSGMADLARETNDSELLSSCKAIFDNISNQRMYITGGIGSTRVGESFSIPYDLANEHAYSETCASIGLVFFAKRMCEITNESKYHDVLERALYNGMLSGISLDGKHFFYENPLKINLENHKKKEFVYSDELYPITERVEVFSCSCCPPNLNRILASLGDYIYGYSGKNVYVNQFMSANASENGIDIKQETNYPTDGKVHIETNAEKLFVRIPSWCESFTASCPYTKENGYAVFSENNVDIEFKMEPVLIEANPKVLNNAGKAALMHGPLVYCLDGADNNDVFSLFINKNLDASVSYDDYFGANIIEVKGFKKCDSDSLYYKLSDNYEPATLKFIPYYGFANRGENDMTVWVNAR